LDTRHGKRDRDTDVDIEKAPVRWQCPEESLEMPVVQNAFRCNEGIVSVFELLIQIGHPHRVSETMLRASSHVTSAKSSEICISTRSGAEGDARPEPSQIVPEVPGSRVQDKLGPLVVGHPIKPSILHQRILPSCPTMTSQR
jgi:hypothetical protein